MDVTPRRWRKHAVRSPLAAAAAAIAVTGAAALGCTVRDAVNLAVSRDPEVALESAARARLMSYTYDPGGFAADIRRAREQLEAVLAILRGEAREEWGPDETVTPGRKRYVKYTQSYRSRAIVRFDSGRVRIETVDPDEPRKSLRAAIVTTLLTPNDPRAVDLYNDEPVELGGQPYLYGLVRDHRDRPIGGRVRAEAFAEYLVDRRLQRRRVDTPSGARTVHYVALEMVNDYRHRQAQRYGPLVERYAGRYDVSESLVYAVIKTESDFNPFAVSSTPAYGLMQLVPATGARDAYRYVTGRDRVPNRDYLLDPARNVELGVAYLQLVRDRYLAGIQDPVSLEYCTIAAYNGGAGNVLETFSPDRGRAVQRINALRPPEVYRRLRTEHRRAETRRYLHKVLEARKLFSGA